MNWLDRVGLVLLSVALILASVALPIFPGFMLAGFGGVVFVIAVEALD